MRTKQKRSIMTLLCILLMVGAAQAEFAVENGDFQVGAGNGDNEDVKVWYDDVSANFWDSAWELDRASVSPNGSMGVVFSGNTVDPCDPLGGSYVYQSMGTSMGEESVTVMFDWGHPDDTGEGRLDGVTVSVWASNGSFDANDGVNLLDANDVTLLDSASYEHVALATDGEIWTEMVELDLSDANDGDTIYLRFNNTSNWPFLDNVVVNPKTVVWVTETRDADADGVYDDEDWIEAVKAAGYIVVADRDRYTTMGDDQDVNDANDYVAELNAADLVVISRSTSSGNYDDDANEIANWNSVTTPIINLSAYLVRSNRLDWVAATSPASDNTIPLLSINDANHPIFAGVPTDTALTLVDYSDMNSPGTTFVIDAVVSEDPETGAKSLGNGSVLGTHLFGYPWIVEWAPGVTYYDGTTAVAGGPRMMFMAGGQETKVDPLLPQGAINLTEVGMQVFMNAMDYMIGTLSPEDPGTESMTHLYTFEDGTADDLIGDANGTLVGDANNIYIADGALVTAAQDVWMSMPGDVIDINSYEAATIECWYTPTEGGNTSWSMLAYLGSNAGGVGQNGWFITSARNDNKCRAAISTGSTTPWSDESGVDRPGNIDDGMLHHMVSTLDDTEITFYIDGVLIGTTPLAGNDNSISALSNQLVYLAKGGYDGDPEWIGQVQKFSIYNEALTEGEVLYLYIQGE